MKGPAKILVKANLEKSYMEKVAKSGKSMIKPFKMSKKQNFSIFLSKKD